MKVREGCPAPDQKIKTAMNEVILEKYKYVKQLRLSKEVISSITICERSFIDAQIRGAVFELEAFVLAEKILDKTVPVHFNSPTTWWDMFKIRFFPEWLLTRFSASYTVTTKCINFKEYATYPQMKKVLTPDESGIVRLRSLVTEVPY